MGDLDGRLKALTPLRYCEFRITTGEDHECSIFAGELVHGMSFCEGHAELIHKAIDDSGVDLVAIAKMGKVG